MRVGINAFALGSKGGGIETYVRNVIRGLAAIDPEGDYTLFLQQPLPQELIPGTKHMRRVLVGTRSRFGRIRIPLAFSLALARERLDLVHVQNAAPRLCPTRIVVTLHDIAYDLYPQFLPANHVAVLRRQVPRTLRRAAAVLTDSEASKRDIMRRYRLPPQKVTVALLAADPVFRPLHDTTLQEKVRTQYADGKPFILFTGDPLQRRKNVKTLVDAYVRLRQAGAIEHRLVLSGSKGALDADIFAAARGSRYREDLHFFGRVSDEELVALHNAADLFVYPSIYEGFGLPPLEAMACGTPVVTSNASSLPEVVGDAALTVDPLDVEALASAIASVLHSKDLRARLSAQGLARAAMFSYEKTARTILDVYHNALQPR